MQWKKTLINNILKCSNGTISKEQLQRLNIDTLEVISNLVEVRESTIRNLVLEEIKKELKWIHII